MSRDARFWRNVTIIAVVHVALLVALIRWSRSPQKSITRDITWMNAGAGDAGSTIAAPAASSAAATEPTPEEESVKPTPEPSKEERVEEEKPILTSVPSDIQLPTSTPKPTPSATPTPTATSTPTPTDRDT
jgi:outer membrane biosynthesis protein TonB